MYSLQSNTSLTVLFLCLALLLLENWVWVILLHVYIYVYSLSHWEINKQVGNGFADLAEVCFVLETLYSKIYTLQYCNDCAEKNNSFYLPNLLFISKWC